MPEVVAQPKAEKYLAGNLLLGGSDPLAHCYCGHQFGVFAGQLGDGRAISLGDVPTNEIEPRAEKLGLKTYNLVDL